LSRADVAAIPQNGSTIDFVLLKAQYELQRGLVIYPSHSTGSDSSLIARLLRAAHVMKSATKPLRFKSILPSEVENVMKNYPGMLKNIPTQQQLLTDTNHHLPHFEDTELMYTFFAIPLNVTKDANPISRWEIIANDPNHPISSTNFLITTQFLKHAEEKFGRSSVSLWLRNPCRKSSVLMPSMIETFSLSNFACSVPHNTQTLESAATFAEYRTQMDRQLQLKSEKDKIIQSIEKKQLNDDISQEINPDLYCLLQFLSKTKAGLILIEMLGIEFTYKYRTERRPKQIQNLSSGQAALVLRQFMKKHQLFDFEDDVIMNNLSFYYARCFNDSNELQKFSNCISNARIIRHNSKNNNN